MSMQMATFVRRVGVATAIVAVAGLLLALVWAATDLLLLIFASVLLACFLRGSANVLSARSGIPTGLSLAAVLILVIGGLTGVVWLLAPQVAAQADDLLRGVRHSVQQLGAYITQYEWGRRMLAEMPGVAEIARRGNLLARVTGVFSSTLGFIANTVLVAFLGVYLAAAPGIYTRGLVRLFPMHRRARIAEVLQLVGETLRHWLVGRSILMVTNGVLTAIGLWIIGIPLALTLGVIAGLLNFIPNIGPLIAGVPAVLIAWTVGPMPALYVLLLYVVLQSLDGYVFTPLVQQRTVALAPALTIAAQVLFGVLAGTMGLLLATPLTAAALVLVRKLYLEDVLGDSGPDSASRA